MSPIKIVHVSDLHYSPSNLEESDRCLLAAMEAAETMQPDVIVFSGDSTDHRLDAHADAYLALVSRIKQCADIAPVLILQGTYSHEPPGTIEVFALLGGRYPIAIANHIVQIALTDCNTWVASKGSVFDHGEVDPNDIRAVFTCVPTVNKANLAASLGAVAASTEMGVTIQSYLRNAGVVNQNFARQGIPTIGISHGTVHGCITEHGVPMLGFDHEFTTEALFDAQCAAFLLGHIHKHQIWQKEGRRIAYPGSIGRFHYGEEGDKGFLVWEVEATQAFCQFHATPSCQMQHFDFDGAPDLDLLKQASLHCAGAFVRVRWQIDQEHAQLVKREQIQSIFADAKEVQVDIRILKIQRSRAEGINLQNTLAKKVEKWAELTNTLAAPILDRLEVLTTTSSSVIAGDIIADLARYEKDQLEPEFAV